MAGLVPAIYVFLCSQDVDARHKAGHDAERLPANGHDLATVDHHGRPRHIGAGIRRLQQQRPVEITAASSGSTLRATIDWIWLMICAPTSTLSIDTCGRAAWPPSPSMSM